MTRTEEVLMWERCCPQIDKEDIERIVDELRQDEERLNRRQKPKLRVLRISNRGEYHEYLNSDEWRLVKRFRMEP